MKKLHLATGLELPDDAATQTFAFIGRKGSGKTFGAGKLAELLIGANVQVVVLDTVGNWFGLRLAADGKERGLDVAILGGLRGDIPLEPTGGHLVADVLVQSHRSMILDASQFSKADRQRFAAALGERLWRGKKSERTPTPIHLILEESQLIVPEHVKGDAAVMVGVYEEIIRLGRNYGIGVTMITQRPQSVSKEVLNQTECLLVFQVNGAHERKALKEWIVYQGMDTNLLDELPGLQPGDCYVWSPQWLNLLKRVRILPKKTFDSSSTPKVGGSFRGVAVEEIDLRMLKEQMAATIERAKTDDPKELRKQIADLRRQLAVPGKTDPAHEAVTRQHLASLQNQNDALLKDNQEVRKSLKLAHQQLTQIRKVLTEPEHKPPPFPNPAPRPAPTPKPEPARPPLPAARQQNNGDTKEFGKCHRAILAVLKQHGPCTAGRLTLLAGYRYSGGFKNALSDLRTAGLIVGENTGVMQATNEADAYDVDQLPGDLKSYWLNHRSFGKCHRAILQALLENPNGMTAEQLCEWTGYQYSGGFKNALSDLRTAGVLVGRNTETMTVNEHLV